MKMSEDLIDIMIEANGGWEKNGWIIKYIERSKFNIWFV